MSETKDHILLAALSLFARDGYEAVSVRQIAAELGMTKGALYRHYINKQDIFHHILLRMEQRDAENAAAFSLPEGTLHDMPEQYRSASLSQFIAYSKAQFRYWTQDSFAAPFRRMLTLEQYRSETMGALYQQYLASGPLDYVADLLSSLGIPQPRFAASQLYAPMFLFYNIYDHSEDKEAVLREVDRNLDQLQHDLLLLSPIHHPDKEVTS